MKPKTDVHIKIFIILIITLLSISTGFFVAGSDAAVLDLISVKPSHAHRVAAGTETTFVLRIHNTEDSGNASATVVVNEPAAGGWNALVSPADINFQPTDNGSQSLQFDMVDNESRFIVVKVIPESSLANGQTCEIIVNAGLTNGLEGDVTLHAVVNNQPKVYLLIIDGASPLYVRLDRHGSLNTDTDANYLMPNIRNFMQNAARFPDARDSLPATTDPNVFGILSGSWPGTSGIPTVGYQFKGWDAQGAEVITYMSAEKIRYGQTGQRVLSIFDVAKSKDYGGDNETFTALIAGKFHIPYLFQFYTHPGLHPQLDILDGATDNSTDNGGVLRPLSHTEYLLPPQEYVLGDPCTDNNASSDRDGVNIEPPNQYKMILSGLEASGSEPEKYPSDRWIAESALRIIAVEDPDIFAVHLGNVDKVEHGAGAADIPAEWIDFGTPGILWDDINIFNRNANRETVLDVIYEADNCTGLILNTLNRRKTLDTSITVIASDHGQQTYMNDQLNVKDILNNAGNLFNDYVHWYFSTQEVCFLYLNNKSDAAIIETALENYTVLHPVLDTTTYPFAVINQDEMLNDFDNGLYGFGQFGRTPNGRRSELFSEWLIDFTTDNNSKVVWPDLMVNTNKRFQFTRSEDDMTSVVGGHSGKRTMNVMFAIKGPDFKEGNMTTADNDTSLVDIVPTIYKALGWAAPENVDGRILNEILP